MYAYIWWIDYYNEFETAASNVEGNFMNKNQQKIVSLELKLKVLQLAPMWKSFQKIYCYSLYNNWYEITDICIGITTEPTVIGIGVGYFIIKYVWNTKENLSWITFWNKFFFKNKP